VTCDAQTLASLIKADGLASLSGYDLLCCLASIYATSAGYTTAQDALTNAKAQGMPKLSDLDLWMAFEAAIC